MAKKRKKEIHVQNFEDLLLAGKASNIKNNWFNISREDEIFIQRTEELNSLQNESSIYCQSSRIDLLPSYPFSISQSLSMNRVNWPFGLILKNIKVIIISLILVLWKMFIYKSFINWHALKLLLVLIYCQMNSEKVFIFQIQLLVHLL